MAFTVHWSNHTVDLWRGQESTKLPSEKKKSENKYKPKQTALDYREKLGSLTPVLSLTSDVLYPNAEAALENGEDASERLDVGCKGHQIDEDFPLISRIPTCVPLVQYSTAVNKEDSWEEQDICALPVLNWENYVNTFKQSSVLSKVRRVNSSDQKQAFDDSSNTEDSEAEDFPNEGGTEEEESSKSFGRKKLGKSQGVYGSLHTENYQSNDESEGEHLAFTGKSNRIESLTTLRKYTNVPTIKVEGTWNYNYHHAGACDWTREPSDKNNCRTLLVGKGRFLRAVKMRQPKSPSAISFVVEEVYDEEEQYPLEKFGSESGRTTDNVVFQVTAHKQESLAAVRRGVTLDIYSTVDVPRRLTTIPLNGYRDVLPRSDHSAPNGGFISCDLNLHAPYEVASLDTNYSIKIHDFVQESSSGEIKCNTPDECVSKPSKAPQFPINRSAGVLYASDHRALYYYYDSSVYFFDTREDITIMNKRQAREFHPLIDLKCDSGGKAISDQRYFSKDSNNRLHEYISCVQRSQHPNYFYIGTSERVLLMDWRVPKNPVIKMNHGMKSPAAYISTNYNKNFEVVVAASQRSPQVFSAVLDHAHISCKSRSGCSGFNPVLSSYPRHLSNPEDFFNTAEEDGVQFIWEEEQQRTREHCSSWCTGLTIGSLPDTRERSQKAFPPGSFVVTTNNFGDVFYQEWIRNPTESHKLTNRTDTTWKNFLSQWHNSVRSQTLGESLKPSKNPKLPEDCSLLIEPNFAVLKHLPTVREIDFDPLELDNVRFHETNESTQPLKELCDELKKYRGSKIEQFVDVWEKDWKPKTSIGILRPVGAQFEDNAISTTDDTRTEDNMEGGDDITHVTSAADFVRVEIKEEVADDAYELVDESEVQILPSVATESEVAETVTMDEAPEEDLARTGSFSLFGFQDSQSMDDPTWNVASQNISSQGSFFTEDLGSLNLDASSSWNVANIPSSLQSQQNSRLSSSASYPTSKKRAGF